MHLATHSDEAFIENNDIIDFLSSSGLKQGLNNKIYNIAISLES